MPANNLGLISQATVRICDANGDRLGQGVCVPLRAEKTILVLTCYHVVAKVPDRSRVPLTIFSTEDQEFLSIRASYCLERSDPDRDIAVLTIVDAPIEVLGAALVPLPIDFPVPADVVGIVRPKGSAQRFNAKLAHATPLSIDIDQHTVVEIPRVWRLRETDDVRPGISGSSIVFEDGVIGLTHFSRTETTDYSREAYVVPIESWFEKNPEIVAFSRPYEQQRKRARNDSTSRNRDVLLSKVQNYWLSGVLDKSLQQRPFIVSRLRERLDRIELGRRIELGTDSLLPEGTRVIDVFDRLGAVRTLLVTGQPGCGKTIELLTLCRTLCDRAERDERQPTPVILNLSSWRPHAPTKTFAEWVVRRLSIEYHVPVEQGASWVAQEQLALLLDGLDEVASPLRDLCAESINAFLIEHGATDVVVCSRSDSYANLHTRLNLQWAIEVEPLTGDQVSRYLAHCGESVIGLRATLEKDGVLQELASKPLMLNIMSFAYEGDMRYEDWGSGSVEDSRRRIFAAYIDRMLKRRSHAARYRPKVILRTIEWLAQVQSARSQSVFLIEQLQPEDLTAWWQRASYWLIAATLVMITPCIAVFCCVLTSGPLSGPLAPPMLAFLIASLCVSSFGVGERSSRLKR